MRDVAVVFGAPTKVSLYLVNKSSDKDIGLAPVLKQ